MLIGSIKLAVHSLFIALALGLLVACAEVSKPWDPQAYTVIKGDTLYSIAWRYEKDFRQIAEWNNIGPPYAIYPGQRLAMQPVTADGTLSQVERPQVLVESGTEHVVITPAVESKPVVKAWRKRSRAIVQSHDTLYSIARREGFSHHQLARWNHLKSPYMLKPGQKLRLSPPATSLGQSRLPETVAAAPLITPLAQSTIKATPLATRQPEAVTDNNALPSTVAKWLWPVNGRVSKTYKANDTSRKGIGISGKLGQPVKAAARGTVVYSGNGLINYGNLVIIKHSHSFLSAYAHNNSLLVKEGDSVKPGQVIAKMGSHDSKKPQLHFEIRRNGKPVNPLKYLPRS